MAYESARKRFDQDIKVGSRVALAPHLDLWMAGVRYGEVIAISRIGKGDPIYTVRANDREVRLGRDDLLGALH